MNTTSFPRFIARCALSAAALCVVAGAVAGPTEDLAEAERLIRSGDVFSAMTLLRKSADQNHAPAQARLGDLMRAAEFEKEAADLYRKAADQGDPAGQFGLGKAYADGAGVARNPELALELYRKAEKQNHWPALDALARAYRAGDLGLPRDLAQAQELEGKVRALQASSAQAAK